MRINMNQLHCAWIKSLFLLFRFVPLFSPFFLLFFRFVLFVKSFLLFPIVFRIVWVLLVFKFGGCKNKEKNKLRFCASTPFGGVFGPQSNSTWICGGLPSDRSLHNDEAAPPVVQIRKEPTRSLNLVALLLFPRTPNSCIRKKSVGFVQA